MKRSMHVPLLLAMGLSASLAACQLLLAIDDEQGVQRPAQGTDAGADAQIAEDASAPRSPDECTGKVPPAANDAAQNGTSLSDMYFAVRSVGVVSSSDSDYGYNLDGLCSPPLDASEGNLARYGCESPATESIDPHPDSEEGIDNLFARLQRALRKDYGSTTDGGADTAAANFNARINDGVYSVFVDLYDYNGLADDPDVLIALNSATSFVNEAEHDPDSGAPLPRPRWNGDDEWTYADVPLVGTKRLQGIWRGYVVGHNLVVSKPTSAGGEQLKFTLGNALFELDKPLITATLKRDDSGVWSLRDGVIAGYASPEAVVRIIGHTTVGDFALCRSPDIMDQARLLICNTVDLSLAGGGACDRMSFAIRFEAIGARRKGPMAIDPSRVSDCTDAGANWTKCPATP